MKQKAKSKKSIAADIVAKAEARKREAAKAEAQKDKQKVASEKAKKGTAIILAAEKGRELTKAVTGDHYLSGLQRAIGGDFNVTAIGLTLSKGAKPSDEEMTKVIAGLAGATEGLRKAEGSTTFALGDACLITKQLFPDQADNIIVQAANRAGREKHTIIQAMRVAEFFPKEERVEGLTFTHFQEAMNYAKEKGTDKLKITKAALGKMFEEAFVVEGVPIKKAEGKNIEARKEPISVREFRERLQEKVGKTPAKKKATKAKADEPEEHLFLYISDTGDVKWSEGFDAKACKEYGATGMVIDATDKTVLTDKGAIEFQIKELEKTPENVVPMKEDAPKEKAEKPKKEAPEPKAKKMVGIPD